MERLNVLAEGEGRCSRQAQELKGTVWDGWRQVAGSGTGAFDHGLGEGIWLSSSGPFLLLSSPASAFVCVVKYTWHKIYHWTLLTLRVSCLPVFTSNVPCPIFLCHLLSDQLLLTSKTWLWSQAVYCPRSSVGSQLTLWALKSDVPGRSSSLGHLPVVWSRVTYLTSQSLTFVHWKMGIMIPNQFGYC